MIPNLTKAAFGPLLNFTVFWYDSRLIVLNTHKIPVDKRHSMSFINRLFK